MKLLIIDKREAPTVAEQVAAAFLGKGKLITNKEIKEMGGIESLKHFILQNEDIYTIYDINKQRFYTETISL